jgi:hypothetical protein
MKLSLSLVKNFRSVKTLRTIERPSMMGILGYKAVTSAHKITLLAGKVLLCMSRKMWRDEVHTVGRSFRTGWSSLSRYTEVW